MFDKSGRSFKALLSAPFSKHHWLSAFNWLRVYERPFHALRRYLWADENYPATFVVRTRGSNHAITAYSFHDLLTINEVFCRSDYPVQENDRVAVDFGSNIGLTILHFLVSGAPDAFAYGFEPVPQNCDRLRQTLRGFESRYELNECAVADYAGRVKFDMDSFGRYGGIGAGFETQIEVECRRATDVVAEILSRHSHIDILKIDIEGLEEKVLRSLPHELRQRIRKIYVEINAAENPIPDTHSMHAHGAVRQFFLR